MATACNQAMKGAARVALLFFCGAEQDDQRPFATVVRPSLAVGKNLLALGKPSANQLAQD